MICRHCKCDVSLQLIDLGVTPPSNAYLDPERSNDIEQSYSLRVLVCENCWLVQTKDVVDASELFSHDYAYFSSYSTSWLEHSKAYVKQVERRFSLGVESLVAEIASNDGYLLQYFKEKDIPCYGIEPTISASEAARFIVDVTLSEKQGAFNICSGTPISVRELAENIADEYGRRDLLSFGARPNNVIEPPRIVGIPNS